MDYGTVFAISAGGMRLERTRVEVAALNLANAHTVIDAAGHGYRPLQVLATTGGFGTLVEGGAAQVPEARVEPTAIPPRLVRDPGHPMADEQGHVRYPGVDPATQMVQLMAALRAYEANVAAMNTARTLALRTLEIGRGA